MRTQTSLEKRSNLAMICTGAVPQRQDCSWPAQLLIGLVATTALVYVFYLFIDQPVIKFFRECHLGRIWVLPWLTRPPEVFLILSPLILLAGLIRRGFAPWNRVEIAALAVAVSTLASALAVLILKFTFGRMDDGFQPFRYGAFPSGHTAGTVSVMVVAHAVLPQWRVYWWAIAGIVAMMLVVLAHHYIGDIFGGAFLGWAIGGTAVRAFGLKPLSSADPSPL